MKVAYFIRDFKAYMNYQYYNLSGSHMKVTFMNYLPKLSFLMAIVLGFFFPLKNYFKPLLLYIFTNMDQHSFYNLFLIYIGSAYIDIDLYIPH